MAMKNAWLLLGRRFSALGSDTTRRFLSEAPAFFMSLVFSVLSIFQTHSPYPGKALLILCAVLLSLQVEKRSFNYSLRRNVSQCPVVHLMYLTQDRCVTGGTKPPIPFSFPWAAITWKVAQWLGGFVLAGNQGDAVLTGQGRSESNYLIPSVHVTRRASSSWETILADYGTSKMVPLCLSWYYMSS